MSEVTCPLCGGFGPHRVLEEAELPHRVLVCPTCDYGFVHPLPSLERLAEAYGEDYYEPWRNEDVEARRCMWAWRLAEVLKVSPKGKLLEVGAGDGDFLNMAAAARFKVEVTEFSEVAVTNIRKRVPKARVHQGEIESLDFSPGVFDAVVAWHSLEHMRFPFRALTAMQRVLKPGGVLILAVPNRHNHLMRFFYRFARGRSYPLFSLHTKEIHLSHFTPRSLKRAVEDAGFEVKDIIPDRAMVELAKRVIDAWARISFHVAGHIGTEAMLLKAVKEEND